MVGTACNHLSYDSDALLPPSRWRLSQAPTPARMVSFVVTRRASARVAGLLDAALLYRARYQGFGGFLGAGHGRALSGGAGLGEGVGYGQARMSEPPVRLWSQRGWSCPLWRPGAGAGAPPFLGGSCPGPARLQGGGLDDGLRGGPAAPGMERLLP